MRFCGRSARDPDQRNYVVSNERMRQHGFEARRGLDEGIDELIKGYRMMPSRRSGAASADDHQPHAVPRCRSSAAGPTIPVWYKAHGGAVLGATINKFCYITCRYLPPFFEHRFRVVYSKIENVRTVDEIAHPGGARSAAVPAARSRARNPSRRRPPRASGMGSSSAFTVGLLHALYALAGRMPSRRQLARESIHIERDRLGETVGSQDQVLAAYGGFNQITFTPDGEFSVRAGAGRAASAWRSFIAHLMLFFTGVQRTASHVAASYVNGLDVPKAPLARMNDLVQDGLSLLMRPPHARAVRRPAARGVANEALPRRCRLDLQYRRDLCGRRDRPARSAASCWAPAAAGSSCSSWIPHAGGREEAAPQAAVRAVPVRIARQPDRVPRAGGGLRSHGACPVPRALPDPPRRGRDRARLPDRRDQEPGAPLDRPGSRSRSASARRCARDDVVFGTYRGHALYLAKGGDLRAMIAELYGKATGCAGGKGGSMHLIDVAPA